MRTTGFLCGLVVAEMVMAGAGWAQTTAAPIQLKADYKVTQRFAVPGEGNWDYISVDSGARRLYVSHGDAIQVLNADNGKVVGQVAAPGAHGVALVKDLHKGFTSNGGDKTVTVFDTKTLAAIKTVKLAGGTDGIVYEPFSGRVFALSEKTTAIDAASGAVVGSVDLGAGPEGAASDGKGSLYVAVPKLAGIVVVDAKALSVGKTIPTGPCKIPRTVIYDAEQDHLLVGCSDRFVIVDPVAGKVVGGSLQCSGVDSGAHDAEDKLIFESCTEGVVSVIRQMTKNNYRTVATIPTQMWAGTMAFDPATKRMYLPTAEFEFIPSDKPDAPPNRVWKPGTFSVLVVSRK